MKTFVVGSVALLASATLAASASAQSSVVCWGSNSEGQCNVPPSLDDVMAVDGLYHCVALRANGTVACWGRNGDGQCNVPANLPSISAVSAGVFHTLVLANDGTVYAWGLDNASQCSGPAAQQGAISIAAAGYGSVVAFQDGTARGWGGGRYEPPSSLSGVVQVVGEDVHAGARRGDGTVVCWGASDFGQSNVPPGLTHVVKLAMGAYHSIAVKADGSLVTWGSNSSGQRDVPTGEKFADADGGNYFSIGMTADGRVLCWGANENSQLDIPTAARSGALQVACGGSHGIALIGPPVTVTNVRPVSAPSTGGTVVTITGSNFRTTSRVWFGGIESTSAEVLSNTSIRATVPAHGPGEVDLRVDYGSSTGFYYRPECGSDLDQDGEVTASDIAIVLLDFGPCYAPLAASQPEDSRPFMLREEPVPEVPLRK
jgi:alpha-tubulin suppressor-like RCC1 family protein